MGSHFKYLFVLAVFSPAHPHHNFARWMQKVGLPDTLLSDAIYEMERGLIDADLGGGVLKKRIALAGMR